MVIIYFDENIDKKNSDKRRRTGRRRRRRRRNDAERKERQLCKRVPYFNYILEWQKSCDYKNCYRFTSRTRSLSYSLSLSFARIFFFFCSRFLFHNIKYSLNHSFPRFSLSALRITCKKSHYHNTLICTVI